MMEKNFISIRRKKPTLKQKRAAELLIENATLDKPLNGGEIVENSGYGVSMSKNPQVILESEGVKQALEDYGFSIDNAKKVVAKILLDDDQDANARLKASDQVFKVHGGYAPEKNIQMNVEVTSDEIKALTEKLNALHSGNESENPSDV